MCAFMCAVELLLWESLLGYDGFDAREASVLTLYSFSILTCKVPSPWAVNTHPDLLCFLIVDVG